MNSPPSRASGMAALASTTSAASKRRAREAQHAPQHRPVERDQHAVERIAPLVRNAPADEVAHQHGHQRDRKAGRGRHRVGLGVGERREQPPLLRLEREHRHERERDDEQARRTAPGRPRRPRRAMIASALRASPSGSSGCCVAEPLRDACARSRSSRRRVHHRADRDRDAAERHDVGVDTLVVHDDERDEDPERQRDDRDERRAQVKQEQRRRRARRR